MLIICDKCNKDTEARVTKIAPHRIQCEHCGHLLEKVNKFTLDSLVREKKFVVEQKKAFAFFCDNDKAVLPGILTKDPNGKLFVKCAKCSSKMNVSEFMINQFRDIIQVQR